MRIETEVKMVRVDQKCDGCKEGLMRPTGVTLLSNPPQYPHRCTKCNHHQSFHTQYPTLEAVDAN